MRTDMIDNLSDFRNYIKKYYTIKARLEILEDEIKRLSEVDPDEEMFADGLATSSISAMPHQKSSMHNSITERAVNGFRKYDYAIRMIKKEKAILNRYVKRIDTILKALNKKELFVVDCYMQGNTYEEISILYNNEFPKKWECFDRNINMWLKKILLKMFHVYNISEVCRF